MSNPYGPPGGGHGGGPPSGPPKPQQQHPPQSYPQAPQPSYPQQPPYQQQPQPSYPQQQHYPQGYQQPRAQPGPYRPPNAPYPQQHHPSYPQHHQPSQPPYGQQYPQQPYAYPPQNAAPQQGFWAQQQANLQQSVADTLASADRTRRYVGLGIWVLGMVLGVILNIAFQALEIFGSKNPGRMFGAVVEGAIFAFVPLCVYLTVPAVLDRYDPEPWWCLAMAFLWGAVVATGAAGFINTIVHVQVSGIFGKAAGEFAGAVISAPLCEEFSKGLAVFGTFYFLRREFDGVVDGIIYAIFCALGFAAVENVDYYARAEMMGEVGDRFFLRGVLTPWLHPLFTSMTGIGFGISREATTPAVKWLAPLAGFFVGVTLHAIWNFIPTVLGGAFWYLIPFWLLFVLGFFGIVIALVVRKGRVIRQHLKDEVLIGNLSQEEVDLITSPIGRLTCTFSWRGKAGRDFIASGARLALSKWHTARAMKGQKKTISADFIVPMRLELKRLRGELMARMPR